MSLPFGFIGQIDPVRFIGYDPSVYIIGDIGMKFKVIFLVFNTIIFLSFLFIFLMPLLMLGWEYTRLFWLGNWYLGILFLVVMGVLNTYFILNWKLFEYLEREDWDGLIAHLEDRIYRRGQLFRPYVRLLINTYIVRSRHGEIRKLEEHLRSKRPELLPVYAFQLGLPYLMANDAEAMGRFYAEFLSNSRTVERAWVRFNYAFARILMQQPDEARETLFDLAASSPNPAIQLLSAYFLHSFYPADEAVQRTLETARSQFTKRFSASSWSRELERMKTNIEVVMLGKLIREAEEWMFQRTLESEST
jgi:hypothetical protein